MATFVGWPATLAHLAGRSPQGEPDSGGVLPLAEFVRAVPLAASDVVYNPADQTLYVSVPSSAGDIGNSIVPVNPATGEIGAAVFVGSEPGRMAMADDGRTLYVHLDGAKAVRRYDTQARTAGLQFSVGADRPADMRVVPGSPNSLAVARGTVQDGGFLVHKGVAVFDDGVQRPNTSTGGTNFIGLIAFGASASTLYGHNNFGDSELVKFQLDSSGVSTAASSRGFVLGRAMELVGGRLYGAAGRVYDPEAGTLLGTFSNAAGQVLVVDPANGRIFFLSSTSFGGGFLLSAYDINTFLPVGSVLILGVPFQFSEPTALVRWGTNGLAFSTRSAVYLVQTTLVSDAEPIPSSLQFSASAYTGNEASVSNNTVTVTVTRAGGISGTSTVNYATSDGTATAGADYTAVSGTLNFADGELTKTFSVPILDDNVFEGTETVNLTLSSPTGATLGTPATAVLNINDNESQPSVNPLPLLVVEGDAGTTAAELTVRLTNATTKTVTVNYATADGTATAGTDYTAVSGTLTFQPGELEKKIALQIVGDAVEESNETFFVDFSNATNAFAFARGSVTILDDERPTVQFSAASFSANESAGRITATVTRFGDVTTPASVDYLTLDDTRPVRCDDNFNARGAAFARCDYATTIDTLAFAPGERQKTFAVPLVDDGHDEPNEFVRVQLFAPSGVTLGTQLTATLLIEDNDAPGAANPLDNHAFFVRQHYLDFLGREPEAAEPWTGVLERCPNAFNSDPNSPSAACDRNIVSSSFFRSREFELKGYFVYRFYRATLGRRPRYTEFTFDMRRVAGATSEDVFARRRAFSEAWLQRPDVANLYGALTNAQFVGALLGRYGLDAINAPDPAAPDGDARVRLTRDELVAALDAQRLTRAQVMRAFVESSEVDAAEFNGAFVTMQYLGYLRRDPDLAGFNAWLAVLNRGDGFRVMIDGFMNSQEYRLRFGKE